MSSVKHVITAPDCAALLELIPDYAFGLTSADETRYVEANLHACPEALAQLDDFRHIQDDMRENVPQVEPSAQFEARLFAAVRLEAEAAPAATLTPEQPAPSMVVRPVHVPATPALPLTVQKSSEAQPRRAFPLGWLAAAAAVIALVLTNIYWLSQVSGLSERMVRLENEALRASQESFVLSNAKPLNWSRMSPDEGTGIEAAAFLMWNEDSDRGLLYVRNLPEPEPGKTYQLWFVEGEELTAERTSAGTFSVDADGNAVLVFEITEPIDNYLWARITDAPDDGSDPDRRILVHGVVNEQAAANAAAGSDSSNTAS